MLYIYYSSDATLAGVIVLIAIIVVTSLFDSWDLSMLLWRIYERLK